ncbi:MULTISPECIES: winged helix-turn-helix transcriptional regulator [Acinetobacter]|jgi:DNA-binding HxlR family transcriptional regulator|uniref:Transcriptional regulator n=1 Tax=Acinetobacter pittii TaxID=48296 RepID=A0A242U800_ACIPI|nr:MULTISPECIES: helix-turn-helix domain-containing protein [Acinetobacter]EXS21291.1 hxlR-like helix-turn-helix family protein [Acinetobacter baumannii 573719]MBJ8473023.1 helix-turn-helix transcriptional regulator [Acinetobacter pittii]MBJ8502525.1 helix-turn-helix transcriptional regulator [Acinetobacter pittii]MBJ9893258.1 helix-turn-helix transcriptional regulator [Acinetobacter pittii]MCU4479933.1 helix-turn-helix transcriptional regulator [Acinetobacter sp. WU_MDCI_Abxd143]
MNECLKYNVFQQHCPARLFFEKIADKWVLLILNVLEEDTQHFNLLKKNIQGISPKVLSQKLKMLERDGFIERKIQNTTPIRVDYSLTSLGQNVAAMAFQLKEWAETNIEQVLAAQMTYDEKVLEQA